jgi:DNA-binding NtrC family response regulator
LDLADVFRRLDHLLVRMSEAQDRATFFDDCLDALAEQLHADRALLVLFFAGGAAQVIQGRADRRPLDADEREELSRTMLHEARATRKTVVRHPLDESDGTESMYALGIATAIAVPITPIAWQRVEPEGVLYFDYRRTSRQPDAADLALLEAAARLLGAVLGTYAELSATRETLRERAARDEDPVLSLDELLAPASMHDIRDELSSAVRGSSPILLLGRSGSGKTELARAIAIASGRTPIVRATLGSSDDLNTITSELFGHERGAFSGALQKRIGLVEYADGGTLIFDEILNLPPPAQQLLLDFTQFGTYRPLGHASREPKRAKVRIVAATNGDLARAVAEGRFREDLYFRLAGLTLTLPALADRPEDVPAIAESMLVSFDPTRPLRLSLAARRLLASDKLPWPGNVRQLAQVMRRARERAQAAGATVIAPEHLRPRDLGVAEVVVPPPREGAGPSAPLASSFEVELEHLGDSYARLVRERSVLDAYEKQIVETALLRANGVVAVASRDLGLPRTSLLSRMETLGLKSARKART